MATPADERLQRVEEAVAFGEHQQEQLGQALIDLSRRLDEVTRRIAALEARLAQAVMTMAEREDPERSGAGDAAAGGSDDQ